MNDNNHTVNRFEKNKIAQNRLQGTHDIKSIYLSNMQFELVDSKRISSNKEFPTGEYQLFVHRKELPIDESVVVSSSSETLNPSKINAYSHGSISHVGSPTSIMEPNTWPMIGTAGSPLTIGIDTEWIHVEDQRDILSYQFITAIPDAGSITYYALIVFPYASTFSLNRCLHILVNTIWKNHGNVFKPNRCVLTKSSGSNKVAAKAQQEVLHIQLAAHFGCVDISSFYGAVNKIFPKLLNIQKTVVSCKPFSLKLSDDNRNSRLASVT